MCVYLNKKLKKSYYIKLFGVFYGVYLYMVRNHIKTKKQRFL